MSMETTGTREKAALDDRPYSQASLEQLLEGIVQSSDRQALRELFDHRTPLRWNGGPAMGIRQFIEQLCYSRKALRWLAYDQGALPHVCDLTVDRFAHLPADPTSQHPRRPHGPDCRYYLGSVLTQLRRWRQQQPGADPLAQERAAARILQRMVVRHFRLSCQEARRGRNPGRSRYAWRLQTGSVFLWMPTWMPGWRRRAWLEQNVRNVDPGRPGEQLRVQAVVDAHLGVPRIVPFDKDDLRCQLCGLGHPLAGLLEEEIGVRGLSRVLADEKGGRCDSQRPAIRALGPNGIRRLVRRIFTDLSEESYQEKDVARAFGLSSATLSRFAGIRWRQGCSGHIPDLWRNTAHVLASTRTFIQVAEEAGVWQQVRDCLGSDGSISMENLNVS